ncbi:MAG: hypothetical protein PWQ37_1505 [Candidatus Petromonas sp.]|nr:hypothetical protein [Candidatus Petromonas sp.]
MYIFFNNEIIKSDSICILPISEGFMYGYGLFETIKVAGGKMYFFHEHVKRLLKGCQILDLNFNIDLVDLEKYCYDLIDKNKLFSGALRISYSKNKEDCNLLISTRNSIYHDEDYEKGFKLCFSDMKRNPYSPLVRVKSNNYMENLLARKKAKDSGYDEALFFNVHGEICEGTISNIFFVKNEGIFTPTIECGILSGILRSKVIEIINENNLKIDIGRYKKDFLYDCDEIFITNSLMDIMPVSLLQDKKMDLKSNKITRFLMEELKKLYG